MVAPGGIASILARNQAGIAVRAGFRGRWAEALAALQGETAYVNELGASARADVVADLIAMIDNAGLELLAWYGVRVLSDNATLDANPPPPGSDELATLLAAEELAGRTDPYRQVAPLFQVIAKTPREVARQPRRRVDGMEFRHLGNSGLRVSALAYGNWLTHGAQVEEDAAHACVRAALDAGITTFDTADIYANGRAEEVLGRALAGERREGLEIFTKVYWDMGPGQNDAGLSRKHIFAAIDASLRRLGTDYVDLYQAHRYDVSTPLEETMLAFADVVRAGKALYIGVSEWDAEQLRAGAELARELHVPFISNQPQYSMLYRVIEAEVVPASRELGIGQIVWSPIAQGVLTGKYKPGAAPARVVARDHQQRRGDARAVRRRRDARAGAAAAADRRTARRVTRTARDRVGAAQRQRRRGDHRCLPAGAGDRQRRRARRQARRRRAAGDRRGPRGRGRDRSAEDPQPARAPGRRLIASAVTPSASWCA